MAFGTRVVTIEVTAEDIEKGIPDDSGRCAFARALNRVFPGSTFWNCKMYIPEIGTVIATKAIEEFGENFDAGRPVKPKRFRLTIPGRA